jgi:TPR repeat protein
MEAEREMDGDPVEYYKWLERYPYFQHELAGHVRVLLKSVEGRSAAGLFNLGDAYQNGLGVKRSLQEAASYYRAASELGHQESDRRLERISQETLDSFYTSRKQYLETQQLPRKDPFDHDSPAYLLPVLEKEITLLVGVLLNSVKNENGEGLLALGDAYQHGLGVERNTEKAHEFLLGSSRAGNTKAMVRLGRLISSPSINKLDDAIYWYQKAAEGGNTGGMVSLGFAFREGAGVPIDPVKAAEWFSKAVEAGHKRAKYFLAKVYYYSLNSTDRALPLLLDEAESENNDTFWTLGRIYSDDRTTYYDFEKAAYWYERIANGKYAGSAAAARIALAELHLSGRRQPKNLSKAKQYLEEVISNSPELAGFWKDALKLLGKIEKGKA